MNIGMVSINFLVSLALSKKKPPPACALAGRLVGAGGPMGRVEWGGIFYFREIHMVLQIASWTLQSSFVTS